MQEVSDNIGSCQTCVVKQAALNVWKVTLSKIQIASCVPHKCLYVQTATQTINAPAVKTPCS